MNVTRADQAGQTTTITVTVDKADYAEKLEKSLRDYKRKATVPGFRPGMVPMALVKKTYGKSALADITYRLATDGAFDFIKTQEIDPIGDLMPSDEQTQIDFDTQESFDFVFEIGLAPKVNLDFDAKDKVEKIVVEPSAEMVSSYTDNFLRRFGNLVEVETVEKEEAITCNLDNGDMKIEDAYVGLISLSDDERAQFIGKKVGDKMTINVNEVYKDAKQRAAILSVSEKELDTTNPEFEMEITMIRKFQNPELNADFFALAFPQGDVKDAKAFEAKMLDMVALELASQTEFKWLDTVRDYVISKNDLTLPDEFLKRWLFNINDGKFTMEQIQDEFPQFQDMMKWDLVKRAVAKADKIEITKEDALVEAKAIALAQFRQYGMASVADDMLENYANQILGNKDEAKRIFEAAGEKKVTNALIAKLTVVEKKMTVEQFSKMMQESK